MKKTASGPLERSWRSLAKDLDIVLADKDAMQYGTALVTATRHVRLLRAARRLVAAARAIAAWGSA